MLGALAGCQPMGSVESSGGVRQIESACPTWNCGNCDEWGCGANSAWLGENITFHELDALGTYNDANVAFVPGEFRDGSNGPEALGNPIALTVDRDNLEGISGDGTIVSGGSPGLTNASMLLKRKNSDGVISYYRLRIAGVGQTYFWDAQPSMNPGPVPPPSVNFYDIRYSQVASPTAPPDPKVELPLCSATSEGWGPVSGNVIFFRGDRYKAAEKTEWETGPQDSWFNVACAGTAIAKLHFLHHTLAGAYNPLNNSFDRMTTWVQRQTMLKLITADYCGSGHSYTVNGTPLRYYWATAVHRWHSPYPPDSGPNSGHWESIWKSDGSRALCLSAPRLTIAADGGNTFDEVHAACGLEPCDFSTNWQTQGYALSATPIIPTTNTP
jgi:hypothetical protein